MTAAADHLRRLAPPARTTVLALGGLAALAAAVLLTATLTKLSVFAPLALVGALGFVVLAVVSPSWALFVTALLIPLEGYQVPLGAAFGALSPARAALLVVAGCYAVRALLWPSRVVLPGLTDVPAVLLLLSLLPSLLLGVGIVTVAKVAVNWVAYVVCSIAVRSLDGRGLRRVLLGLGIGGGLLGAQGVLAYIAGGGAHLSNGGAAVYGRAAAGLADSNYYGGLLLLCIVPLLALVIREKLSTRLLGAGAVVGGVLGILLSLSRGATLALFVSAGVVLMAWSKSRRASAGVAIALIAVAAINIGPLVRSQQVQVIGERLSSVRTVSSTNTRPLLWRASLDIMQRHPEGVGVLGFVQQAEERGLTEQGLPLEHAHNSYLNLGVELGLFGLGAFLLLLAHVMRTLWREWRRRDPRTQALAVGIGAAMVGYALQGLTVSLYAVQIIHAVFFLLAGAALALPRLSSEPETAHV